MVPPLPPGAVLQVHLPQGPQRLRHRDPGGEALRELPGSPRLRFRTWTDADLDLALALWGDPQVTAWIGGPLDPGQVAAKLAREQELLRLHGVQYWPMFLVEDDDHVGCCGLRPHSEGVLELGFHLRAAHWGKGLATEAARATIEHAFTHLGAPALFAGHHPENEASRRLLTRLGFRCTHHERYPPTGLDHPSYILKRD